MAIAFLLKIGTTDVTDHIVQNTYKVNNLPVYKTYEDANGATHRRYIRHRYKGEMQMVFKDVADYAAFRTLIENNTSATNFSVTVTAYDNLTGTTNTIYAYLDYDPQVMQKVGLEEYIEPFTMTLEER